MRRYRCVITFWSLPLHLLMRLSTYKHCLLQWTVKMKQLEFVESPSAFIWNHYLTLTHVTFDLGNMTFDLDLCFLGRISNWLKMWQCKVSDNHVFWHRDLDLWPSHVTKIPSMFAAIPNLVTTPSPLSRRYLIVENLPLCFSTCQEESLTKHGLTISTHSSLV